MIKIVFALFCLISLVASQALIGICHLKGTALDPTISGVVRFGLSPDGSSIIVDANITGITQNVGAEHGMHIHQWGDISNSAANATGSHYIGAGVATHGCPNDTVRHAGDMGNWTVTAGGAIVQTKYLDLLPLLNGSNSIIGRAVVLHFQFDDCVTQPTGNASTRLAQCVIGVANPTSVGLNSTTTNVAYADNSNVTAAGCVMTATSNGGNISGVVYFNFTNGLTYIYGQFYNLNASVTSRGIHIHQFGDITTVDGTAAGSHYNPDNVIHAIPVSNSTRHKGDLGNLQYVDGNGTFWYYANNSAVNLFGANNIIGRSVILHIQLDDGCTQPSGNSGSRIGQCVIGILNPNVTLPTVPSGIPDQVQPVCNSTVAPTTTNGPTTSPTQQPDGAVSLSVSVFLILCLILILF